MAEIIALNIGAGSKVLVKLANRVELHVTNLQLLRLFSLLYPSDRCVKPAKLVAEAYNVPKDVDNEII